MFHRTKPQREMGTDGVASGPPGFGVDDDSIAIDEVAAGAGPGPDGEVDSNRGPEPPLRRERRRGFVRSAAIRLAWLAAAAVVALGSAGIVGATEHFPELGDRPELTWAADRAMTAKLNATLSDMQLLSQDVNALGDQARQARGALTQRDRVKLGAAIRSGTAEVDAISSRSASIAQSLGCADPNVLEALRTQNSLEIDNRYRSMCTAVVSTATLSDDWQTVADGTQEALAITDLLVDHDQVAATSTKLGSAGKYKDAISALDGAYTDLTQINQRYTVLSKIADLWTLGQWLQRSQEFDDALKGLWQALITSNGKVTPAVQAAAKAVDDAKALLPYDTSYLSIVLSEIASISVDDAAISIEQAKFRLSAAVGALASTGS